jgi:uncharacterized protein YdhG (YjbR/CyaY superfamily)
MANTDYKSVDEYIASKPEALQTVLESVRSAIRKAIPTAEEVISYQIPAYRLHGRPILWFAGWKQHFSLYPAGDRLLSAFMDDLARYEIKKGTIRFPLSEPVPAPLIERIAAFRASEADEKAKNKTTTPKKAPRKASQKR